MLNRLIDRSVDRSIAAERVYVDDPARVPRLMAGDVALGVASIVAMGLIGNTDGWLDVVVRLFLGAYVGTRIIARMRRAMAYRHGWLDGRIAMLRALSEAGRRGMDMDDWVAGEFARDAAVLGIPPSALDDDQ